MIYSPFGSISGIIHLYARRPFISTVAVALTIVVGLGMRSIDPGPPPAPPMPSVLAIAYVAPPAPSKIGIPRSGAKRTKQNRKLTPRGSSPVAAKSTV